MMLESVTSAITSVLGWVGTVIDALLTVEGHLNELQIQASFFSPLLIIIYLKKPANILYVT